MDQRDGVFSDLNLLISNLSKSAENLLAKFGEFYPFGGIINVINEFELFEVDPTDEKPDIKNIATLLIGGLNAGLKDGRFSAFGVCINVFSLNPNTGKMEDAVRITAIHKNGQRVVHFIPYLKKDGKYIFNEGYFQ